MSRAYIPVNRKARYSAISTRLDMDKLISNRRKALMMLDRGHLCDIIRELQPGTVPESWSVEFMRDRVLAHWGNAGPETGRITGELVIARIKRMVRVLS